MAQEIEKSSIVRVEFHSPGASRDFMVAEFRAKIRTISEKAGAEIHRAYCSRYAHDGDACLEEIDDDVDVIEAQIKTGLEI